MLRVEVRGFADLTATLKAAEAALDVTNLLDEAGAVLLQRIRSRFLAQVDPDGVPWPVSRAAMRRASSGRGGGTLYDTGRLFHSIQLHKTGQDSRSIATDVPYAPEHNLGQKGQVTRVFLGFGEEDRDVVNRIVIRRITEAFK